MCRDLHLNVYFVFVKIQYSRPYGLAVVPEFEIKELKVTKSNRLIESTLIETSVRLALNDQKVVASVVAQLSPDDSDFEEYFLTVSELASMTRIKKENLYIEF